jgi:CBS domain-containing membrane protein
MSGWRRPLRPFGPAVARPRAREILRACIGAGIGLVTCTFLVRLTMAPSTGTGLDPTLLMISPLGGTAMLVFAVPSSPLAQPWSVIVGNTVSALVGVAVVMTVAEPWLALGLSVTLAMIAMMLLRAMHPPAAGVALGTVLTAESVRAVGFSYAFVPVMLDSTLLLLVAAAFHYMTGRVYPFRQPAEHAPRVTTQTGLQPRLAPEELQEILQDRRLDANIGAADLGILIDAAHQAAAKHLFDGVACAQMMTRDVVTLSPNMPLGTVAQTFRDHRVRTLPVVGADGLYQGLVTETDLVRHMHDPATRPDSGVLTRLLRPGREAVVPVAEDVMNRMVGTASEATPLGVLIDLLAEGGQQAVPVLEDGKLIGLVSRSDLIAALARAHHPDTPETTEGKNV